MDRNAINNRLRDYAFSGRAQTAEIPYLYGLRGAQGGPQPLDALGGSAGDLQRGGDLPSLTGAATAGGPADTGLIGPGVAGGDINSLFQYLSTGVDDGRRYSYDNGDGGRGQDGPPDTGFNEVGPLSEFDKNVLRGLGAVPGFGLATGLTRAADFFGLSGVNTPASFGTPGTEEFARNLGAYRAAQERSRISKRASEIAEGERDSIGEHSIGTDVFGEPEGSFDQGYGQAPAPEPSPATGGYNVGTHAVGGGLSYGGPTGSSFDPNDTGRSSSGDDGPIGEGGSPEGGSGGFGGQAGEGAGSGNSADGGRGDSPGYHEGGYVSEDLVPDETRGDVQATIQEGEHVITADAVEMFGQEFFDTINKIAKMSRGK